MTLAAETMSILHPTSVAAGNHKSSKLGFSIDSIVGAKSSSAGSANSSSGSPPPMHHHPGLAGLHNIPGLSHINEAASSRLRDSLTISPTDLSLRHGLSAPNSAVASIASAQEALRHYHNSLLNRRHSSPPPLASNSLSPPPEGHNKSDNAIREARSRSPSRSPPSDDKRGSSASPVSPQPSGAAGIGGHRLSPTCSSPTSPSLVRPIPTSLGGSGAGLPLTAQSYLDHLATFKALYDQSAGSQGPPGSPATSGASILSNGPPVGSPLPPPHFPPGIGGPLGPLGLRPPGPLGGPPGLPHLPFLGGAGGGPGAILQNPQIPREYPLYPWFISRRFPGGKFYILIYCIDIKIFMPF